MKEKSKEKQLKLDNLDNLAKTLDELNKRVKKLVKKNGFSKSLKTKAEVDLK